MKCGLWLDYDEKNDYDGTYYQLGAVNGHKYWDCVDYDGSRFR